MKTITMSFVFILYTTFSFAQEKPALPIIDMHLHAHLPDVPAGIPAPCDPQPCTGSSSATSSSQESLQLTLEQMDRYHIVKGYLSGTDLKILSAWQAEAPGRFIASSFIWEPGSPTIDLLKQELKAGRLAGVGEIATQYAGIAPNDPALEPYFELAEEMDVPVHIHTLGIGAHLPGFRSAAGKPLLLEDVFVKHPDLRLFVENAGYPYFDEMIAIMYQYPQLYADLSTITWIIPREAFHDYLKALVRAGLGKRLLFGSDQMRWPEMIGKAVEGITSADFLTEEQKRDIFYNNAARFLRLSDEQIAEHHGDAK